MKKMNTIFLLFIILSYNVNSEQLLISDDQHNEIVKINSTCLCGYKYDGINETCHRDSCTEVPKMMTFYNILFVVVFAVLLVFILHVLDPTQGETIGILLVIVVLLCVFIYISMCEYLNNTNNAVNRIRTPKQRQRVNTKMLKQQQ